MAKKTNKNRVKNPDGFGGEIEKYVYRRLGFLGRVWKLIAILVIGLVVGASIAAGYFETNPLFGNIIQVIEYAADRGDYDLANRLAKGSGEKAVLGIESDLNNKINPENGLMEALAANSRLIDKYPNNKDLYLRQASLLEAAGDWESAAIYRELARELDPNGEVKRLQEKTN